MPIITAELAGQVSVSALPAVVSSTQAAEAMAPVEVYALPLTVLTPPPTESPIPDAARARVLDENGTFICHLPHAKGIRWLDEHNTPGAGSIDVRRYDGLEDTYPNVWTAGNQVMISIGSEDVFRIILDAEPGYSIDTATGERSDSWAGPGQLGVLNSGMIIPEYGWRAEATGERSFDYGSNPNIGGWVVPSEWKTPVGKPVRKSWRWTFKKRKLPKGWPDRRAQWLWWKNPDGRGVPDEFCYFRSSFTLAAAARVKFWVCGDDTLEFQVDGEIRATVGPGGWKRATTIVLNLAAGNHYVAAKVQNTPASDGRGNRSGFLCTIARVQSDGDVIAYVRRSNTTNWVVRRQLSGPPGWFAAQILRQLVAEQKARSCAGHSAITYGFTTAVDSSKVPWVGRQNLGLTVGTHGLDYVQRLVETGLDVAMTPALKLNVWRRRGSDRSRTVRLDQGTGQRVDETGTTLPPIRNVTYARARTGWVGRTAASSLAAVGRRETMITLGSSRSATQTAAALAALIGDLAYPPQTREVRLSGAVGPQPYRDFDVADWISYRAAGMTTWGRFRVMSISGEINELGYPDWSIQLYEDA